VIWLAAITIWSFGLWAVAEMTIRGHWIIALLTLYLLFNIRLRSGE